MVLAVLTLDVVKHRYNGLIRLTPLFFKVRITICNEHDAVCNIIIYIFDDGQVDQQYIIAYLRVVNRDFARCYIC